MSSMNRRDGVSLPMERPIGIRASQRWARDIKTIIVIIDEQVNYDPRSRGEAEPPDFSSRREAS
jgi:hypothetical protein